MNTFLLSIVIPVFNEKENILPLIGRIVSSIDRYNYELIFVNDGSLDNTVEEIKLQSKKNNKIKLISFNRNFGHQAALSCGYNFAKGDCVVSLDADLQDPPEIIPEMIDKWKKGAKIVYARRDRRQGDNLFKRLTAKIFYQFINTLSDTPIPQEVGDFRLLDKEVVRFLNSLTEHSRFLRGLVAWGGYPIEYVSFERDKRNAGSTHYPLSKMVNFALDGLTSFSTKPLRLASIAGFLSASIGFLGIIYAVLGKIFLPAYWVSGWTALFVGIMFLGGVQLITIGIIGEYITKIYREIQKRPQYLIKEKVNL
ncbi:MAG: glycosyltransferase family 2 protein [Candidatus Roizmanbacteria bacterium]|nr:MAG: glycosyltransferase family 2 protein [Candidatus Roizmanbacteria bacterium]